MKLQKVLRSVLIVFAALSALIPLAANAGPLDSWRQRNPLPVLGNHLYGMGTNQDTCIVVGAGGRLITSKDGYNWTERRTGITDNLYGVAYGNGTWIAVGGKGTILSSQDTIKWTIVNQGYSDDDELRGVVYGKGKKPGAVAQFVAVGKIGKVMTSPDGKVWTKQVSPTNSFMNGIVFAKGTFVAAGAPSYPPPPAALAVIMASDDGVNWAPVYWSLTDNFPGITYGNNLFVAVGSRAYPYSDKNILVSQDGYTWQERPSVDTNLINGVAYGNNRYVAVSSVGPVLTSPDAGVWSKWASGYLGFPIAGTNYNILNNITFFNNMFIAIGSDTKLLTSRDGESWTERPSGAANFLYGVAYDGKSTYAAVGWGGTVLSSTDMVMWVERKSGTPNSLFGITYGNKKFVAVGSDGKIATSANGIKWTISASGFNQALFGIAYGKNTYVAVGTGGKILTSTTGLTWKASVSGTTDTLYGVAYAGNVFVAVGQRGRILSSADGMTWTDRTPEAATNTYCLYGVTFGAGTYVVVGENGTILTSADLIKWAKKGPFCYNALRTVLYTDASNMFVALGSGGIILTASSPDGYWTPKTSGINYSLLGAVYKGTDTFLAVGAYATILSSKYDDQAQWGVWTIRSSGTYKCLKSIAYGHKTFVAVGELGTIQTSKNGATWDLKTLPLVSYLDGVAYGNNRFVAVGNYGGLARVFTSTDDGVTWNQTFPPFGYTPFYPSELYGVTYGGGRFLVGGTDGIILTSPTMNTPAGDKWWLAYLEACYDTKGTAFGDGTYVMVGSPNRTFLTSESPEDWWLIRWAPYIPQENQLGFTKIAFGGGVFTVVGPKVKIVISDDGGVNWRQVPLVNYTGTFDFTGITYGGNNTFTAVGTVGKILTSPNGIDWAFRKSGTTKDLYGMIYGASSSGNTYIGVGKDGIILQSGVVP